MNHSVKIQIIAETVFRNYYLENLFSESILIRTGNWASIAALVAMAFALAGCREFLGVEPLASLAPRAVGLTLAGVWLALMRFHAGGIFPSAGALAGWLFVARWLDRAKWLVADEGSGG